MLAEKENTTNKNSHLFRKKKKRKGKRENTLDLAHSLSISYTITCTHYEKEKENEKEIIKTGSEKEHNVEQTQFTMLLANYVYIKKKRKTTTIG